MANYSAQKIKSVSLNKGTKQYAASGTDAPAEANDQVQAADNQETVTVKTQKSTNNSDSTAASSAKPSSTRPLISPLSEGSKPKPEAKPHPKVAPKKSVEFDWTGMFHRTFFSVYMQTQDDFVGAGLFDYAFNIGAQRLYVLVQQEDLFVDSKELPKKELAKLKQKAATHITKRFQQIRDRLALLDVEAEDELDKVHYLGLTSLHVHTGDQVFQIEHEYGSVFFQEDCVLDLDDQSKVLQLFSLNSFYQIVNLMQTPSDILSFFDYHLPKLVDYQDFNSELELANEFLGSPEFFARAVAVQEKLVEIGLLAKVESRLINLTHPESQGEAAVASKAKIVQDLQRYASMFQKLLNGATKRRHQAEDTIPVNQVKLLVNESMYTRMSIMEEMVAYEKRSNEECRQGYLSHQHSYNDFGIHYVIVVYGLDADAEYSRSAIEQNYSSMLMDINAQLQDPAMSEYFILGFDMSQHDGKGNVTVQMDVFHQSGSEMSDVERHYYEQAQTLAGNA